MQQFIPFEMQILFDFEQTYKLAGGKLIENWSKYPIKLREILASSSFTTSWPRDIEDFLILLKLLPMSTKSPKGVQTFDKSVENLIVFQPVSILFFHISLQNNCQKNSLFNSYYFKFGKPPMTSWTQKNVSPYIVAYGHTHSEIEYSFVVVQQRNMVQVHTDLFILRITNE